MTEAYVSIDDDVIVTLPHVTTGDSQTFLREHLSAEEFFNSNHSTPITVGEGLKRPIHYGKSSVCEFDRQVRVSVFKNDEGDIKTRDDTNQNYNPGYGSDKAHPDHPEYKFVGSMKRVERVKGKERVYFPFVVSRTRVAFTKIKEVQDLRDQNYNDDFDIEAATGEEREEEDYLLFTHSNSGSDRWLDKNLRLDIVL